MNYGHSLSELQMRDIKNLIAGGYDESYVDKWATGLDVNDLLRSCREG